MYGLSDEDTSVVSEAIKEKLQITLVEVRKMKIAKKKYDEQTNYLIYFKHDACLTLSDLKSIRGILGYHVFFENYKKDVSPTQCYNCQRYTRITQLYHGSHL